MDFNVTNILYALAALGGLGFLFGAILAVSAKAFHVKRDARVEEIMKILPCANCGMCGFTGCDAYATAVTKGDAPVSGCSVGGENVAEKVAEVMGTETGEVEEKKRAVAACCGSSKPKFNYVGTKDCLTLSKLGEGVGACQYACLGMGSCMQRCPFGAISMVDNVALVDESKCTGCGLCTTICPRGVIKLVPRKAKYYIACSSHNDAKRTYSTCSAGCIACHRCEKACHFDAIHVIDGVAVMDYDKCKNCGLCVKQCPRNIIRPLRKAEPKIEMPKQKIDTAAKRAEEQDAKEKVPAGAGK